MNAGSCETRRELKSIFLLLRETGYRLGSIYPNAKSFVLGTNLGTKSLPAGAATGKEEMIGGNILRHVCSGALSW